MHYGQQTGGDENAKTCNRTRKPKDKEKRKHPNEDTAIVREAHISIQPTDALFVSHHIIKIPAAERWCAAPSNERLKYLAIRSYIKNKENVEDPPERKRPGAPYYTTPARNKRGNGGKTEKDRLRN